MNRSQRYTWVFWISFILVLFLNLLIWLYVNQVEKTFENELKIRLLSLSQVIGRLIDETRYNLLVPGEQNTLAYIHFQNLISSIRQENSLQSILLFSPSGDILVASPELISVQTRSSLANTPQFVQVKKGEYSVSEIESHAGEQFMSAFGPIRDTDGFVIGVHAIEARANYFEVLVSLKRRLLVFSLLNFMLILLIALGLFRAIRKTIRFETEIKDQEHLVQLGQMAATVAHEVRNPLGIIEGTNDVIKKKYKVDDDDIFTYIPKEIERLKILIENFLRFSRTPKLQIADFKLENLYDRLKLGLSSEELSRLIIHNNPEFTLHSDENLLEQALLNITRNSFQATKQKGSVIIDTDLTRNQCIIRVHDTGNGIRSEDFEHIFTPFFTTRESGNGLGLAISKRLIGQLGGTIDISSVYNSGTTVTIRLPNRK
jgi:signal transduction histidine kinase